jgi:AMP nucleosidase
MAAPKFPTQRFDQAEAALAYVNQLYDAQIAHLREALQRFVAGETFRHPVRAKYPFVRIHTDTVARADSRLSYGFVAGPGTYETTLTRPDLFADYYREQFALLLGNHGVSLEVGLGRTPSPSTSAWANTSTSKAASRPIAACC